MTFDYAGLTDVGRKREHNEDSLLIASEQNLMVVADGMGGHQAGEVASQIAVSTLSEFFVAMHGDADITWPFKMDRRFDEWGNRLVVGIQLANVRIREAAAEEGRHGMGTTCVAALLVGTKAYFAWVGDSRGYLYRGGQLQPITTDHSLQNELLKTGRMKPEDLVHFQHKNVITRALGMAERVEVDLLQVDLVNDDIVLLCCDGLTGMLEDVEIAKYLAAESSLNTACKVLVDAANNAGGTDNITVALARYRGADTEPAPTAPTVPPVST
jgi:protein phosphatase